MRLFPRLVAEEAAEYGGRVRFLAPEVAHRIAAGEVIERPASAVKELIENSLDAGASRVEVEIEGGGVSLIRVRDDGAGMRPEDAERAVGRHATSKIQSAEDLARVSSSGFRGEALHAIGAVSSLALTTSAPCGPGARIRVLAGETVESAPAAHPPGTTVEARNLFMTLPVRRGFLGTERAEANTSYDNGECTIPRLRRPRRRDDGASGFLAACEAREKTGVGRTALRYHDGRCTWW
jgi:DNA mismatch repair protein MutL